MIVLGAMKFFDEDTKNSLDIPESMKAVRILILEYIEHVFYYL